MRWGAEDAARRCGKIKVQNGVAMGRVGDKAGDAAFDKILRSYSEKNSSRVCTLLMTKGARLDELNAKDLTPLHEALADGRNKTSELFREYAAETSAELKAAEK